MFNAIDEKYYQLGTTVLGGFDYDRILSNPPTDKKGNVDKQKWSKHKAEAKKIYNLLTGVEDRLTNHNKKDYSEVIELIKKTNEAKKKGETVNKSIWLTKLEQ